MTTGLMAAGSSPKRRTYGLLILLLALTLVRGVIYLSVIPPWQGPDEPYQFVSAHVPNLLRSAAPQTGWQKLKAGVVASMVQVRFWDFIVHVPAVRDLQVAYSSLPSGLILEQPIRPRAFTYYLLSLPLQMMSNQEVILQLYVMRLFSLLTYTGVVAVAFGVAFLLFPRDQFGLLLLPIAVMFLPQHSSVMAVISDGNPAELFVSLAIYFLVLGLVARFSWRVILAIVGFTALSVAAKPTTFFLVPALMVLLGVYTWRKAPGWGKLLFLPIAFITIYGLTLISPRFDNTLAIVQERLRTMPMDKLVSDLASYPVRNGMIETFRGFWVSFSWGSLSVSDAWMLVLLMLTLLAMAGLIKFWWRYLHDENRPRQQTTLWHVSLFLSLSLLIDLAGMVAWFVWTGYKQGLYDTRYLLGAIIPIVTLLVVGWRELVPPNWRNEGLAVLTSFFFLFDAVVLLNYAVPFFYPLWR